MRLTSLDDLLGPLLAAISPVDPVSVPVEQAGGLLLAGDLVAALAMPPRSVALRSGLAVAALDLVGASAHSPVALPLAPTVVMAGDSLPQGCDAIIDPAAVTVVSPFAEITEPVEPGAYVRLAGHDLRVGHVIATAGTRVTPEIVLAARIADHTHVSIRRLQVRNSMPPSLERDWLEQRLRAIGCVGATDGGHADVIFEPVQACTPRLALRPGEGAWVSRTPDAAIRVELPARFDALTGVWCALILPLLARFADADLAVRPLVLTRKITSMVGVTEVALLRRKADMAQPVGSGDLTLAALACANAFAILPAGSEGLAVGAVIDAIMLDAPLTTKGANA